MKKPVVFIIFNRPETTKIVFEKIRKYAPKRLFVIADGPRKNKLDEYKICQQTRDIVKVDWSCDVKYIYSNENLGCQQRISTGLNEVFNYVEEAIILEDDCVPHETFFCYCEELLDRYKHDQNVMAISGNNFLDNNVKIDDSYYFSRLPHCWGWATWAASWAKWDGELKGWPKLKENKALEKYFPSNISATYWSNIFENCYKKLNSSSWDYIWFYSLLSQDGLAILPNVNLVSNIGFNDNATHTKADSELAGLSTLPMEFPLIHPKSITVNKEADDYTLLNKYDLETWVTNKKLVEAKQNFKGFIKSNGPFIFKDYTEIVIFGMGKWGLELFSIFKEFNANVQIIASGEKIDSYLMLDIETNRKEIYEKSNTKNRLVINSIEGNHDVEVTKKLSEYFKYSEVKSWKFYIEEKFDERNFKNQ